MHIPDGFINTTVAVATTAAAAGAVGFSLKKSEEELGEKQVPLLGVTAAFIFAAQMINFPVAGGTSGHFMGAALAAMLLGPWLSCLVMAVVLIIQCLGFADGGLTALGANILNMGFLGGAACYYLFAGLRRLLPKGRPSFMVSAAFTAWVSVIAASTACALELAFSGTAPLKVTLTAMLTVHAVIGAGEALITTTVLGLVASARPDLIYVLKDEDVPGLTNGKREAG